MRRRRLRTSLVLTTMAIACSVEDRTVLDDAGRSEPADTGSAKDAAGDRDGPRTNDGAANAFDSGAFDSGTSDSSALDSGAFDSGAFDSGAFDSGSTGGAGGAAADAGSSGAGGGTGGGGAGGYAATLMSTGLGNQRSAGAVWAIEGVVGVPGPRTIASGKTFSVEPLLPGAPTRKP
jgi:hypothetical protein